MSRIRKILVVIMKIIKFWHKEKKSGTLHNYKFGQSSKEKSRIRKNSCCHNAIIILAPAFQTTRSSRIMQL